VIFIQAFYIGHIPQALNQNLAAVWAVGIGSVREYVSDINKLNPVIQGNLSGSGQ
jgi:hypothetical protein